MKLNTYFSDFIAGIRPTDEQVTEYIEGQTTLRQLLKADKDLAPVVIDTFLQGSYRRHTAVQPEDECKGDVDVIVVTRLSESNYSPENAQKLFFPFLEKHYKNRYKPQNRSIKIDLEKMVLDFVITSAPSEVDEKLIQRHAYALSDEVTPEAFERLHLAEKKWKLAPLRIPDRDLKEWQDTHPAEQIKWTWEKNASCNKHYVNVVKALKWWHRLDWTVPKYPRSYPLEHIFGVCCVDGIQCIAEGVVYTLEGIVKKFKVDVESNKVPYLEDHGVRQDVLKRITPAEFRQFYEVVKKAATIARKAIDSEDLEESVAEWKKLFGEKFPDPPKNSGKTSGGFTERDEISTIGGGRFA